MAKTAEEKAAAKAAKDAEKAAAAGETEAAPSTDAAASEPEVAKGDIVVRYRDHKGEETSRTFSKEVHGKDFAKLAAEFKETNASRIIA